MENSLFVIFEKLEDPRDNRGKKYRLIDVIMLALYGTLMGFEDFTNMAYYLKKRETELVEELGLENGVPSHDTFSAVFRVIDVKKFMKLFIEWTKSLVQLKNGMHVAIDGKAVRAATKKAENGNIPYVLNAFLCGVGITLGQKMIDTKKNETSEIPKLLDLIDIEGCVVTIDAIGTQKVIMDKICEKNGQFCLQLKRNHPEYYDRVQLYFDNLTKDEMEQMSISVSTQKDHGRIEKRKYVVCSDEGIVANLLDNTRWKHVKAIGMAELKRTVNGETTYEKHFHVLSFVSTADTYATYARSHWEIENNLHWVLDIHFNEDRCTANSDNAIANLSLLRKIAFNLTKLDPSMAKKTTKKKMIDFMLDISVFKNMIFNVLPTVDADII